MGSGTIATSLNSDIQALAQHSPMLNRADLSDPWLPSGSAVKNPPANAGDAGDLDLIPGSEDPLEEDMATHSSILAWRTP